jgi:hypothetical protein
MDSISKLLEVLNENDAYYKLDFDLLTFGLKTFNRLTFFTNN